MLGFVLQDQARLRGLSLIGLGLIVFCCPLNALSSPKPDTEAAPQKEKSDLDVILVGLIAGARREIPSLLVRGKVEDPKAINFQNWQVPYNSVIKVLNFETQSLGEGEVQLTSPGLVTRLNLNQLSEDPELGLVLSIQEIENKLGVEARFDINEYAIILSAPWIGQRRQAPTGFDREKPPQLEGLPKIDPPAFTLTSVEQIANFTPEPGLGGSEWDGDLFAVGTFFGGSYELEIAQPNLPETESWQLDRFQYFRPTPKVDFIAGEQSPFWIEQGQGEYWGLTYLRREGVEPASLRFGSVTPEQRLETDRFTRDITGEAEPGTLVQLTRGKGREVLDEVLVAEDGVYRFENVPFGGRGFQQEYDVLLFPDGQLSLDPEVRTVSFRPLPEQLPAGDISWLISAGTRRQANDFWGEFSEFTGGATLRWGIADSLTLGIGVIEDEGFHGWGELFFRPVNVPLDIAIAGVAGKDLETNIDYQPTSTLQFNFNSNSIRSNARTTWQIAPNLRISGRWDSERGTEFRLNSRCQGANLAASIGLTLDENRQIEWQVQQRWGDLELSYEDNISSTRAEISYEFANDLQANQENRLILDYETREFNERRELATLSWEYRSGNRDASGESLWNIEVGYGVGSQGEGIQADVETTILPGLRLRGRYEGISLNSDEDEFSLELTTRINLQNGISPGDRDLDDLQTQGGLLVQPFFDKNSNRQLDGDEEVYTEGENLLLLNGDLLGESAINQKRDRLLVSLPPDQYRLELDPAGFPLDWQASKTTFAVKVVPGAYTPIKVPLTPSYTVSGTLTDENKEPIGGVRVIAIPEGEGKRRFSITNQGGVFFLEQLQQGTYQLRVNDQPTKPSMLKIESSSPSFQQLDLVLPSAE